jgi:hypothetical protein
VWLLKPRISSGVYCLFASVAYTRPEVSQATIITIAIISLPALLSDLNDCFVNSDIEELMLCIYKKFVED